MGAVDLSDLFGELSYPNVPSKAHPDGWTYHVTMDAAAGLKLASSIALARKSARGGKLTDSEREALALTDEQQDALYKLALGDAHREMITDGVPWKIFKRIGDDAILRAGLSDDAADAALEVERAGESQAGTSEATSTGPTLQSTDGSGSSAASTATPALTRNRDSTLSSSKTPTTDDAAKAV